MSAELITSAFSGGLTVKVPNGVEPPLVVGLNGTVSHK